SERSGPKPKPAAAARIGAPDGFAGDDMRPRIVAGNWKMNGDRGFAAGLVGELAGARLPEGVQAIVMPPFPYLAGLAGEWAGKGIAFGAQDVSEHGKGAYTGEVSASML